MVARALDIPSEALRRFCESHQITELALFGSSLRDDYRDDSDIDVLIDWTMGTPIGLFEFEGMRQQLAAILGREVDLVPKRSIRPALRERILASRRILFKA